MDHTEKEAFFDGYSLAMNAANMHDKVVCTVVRDRTASDPRATIEQMSDITFVCSEVKNTSDFDKVTVEAIDAFYTEPLNDHLSLEWALGYLRDQAAGKKLQDSFWMN